jgi:hypothetical protein
MNFQLNVETANFEKISKAKCSYGFTDMSLNVFAGLQKKIQDCGAVRREPGNSQTEVTKKMPLPFIVSVTPSKFSKI